MKKRPQNILIISLAKSFKDSISSRAAVRNLFTDNMKEINSIILDFKGIEFISRSAAHQVLIETERIAKNKIDVTRLNESDSIQAMFRVVDNEPIKVKKSPPELVQIPKDISLGEALLTL